MKRMSQNYSRKLFTTFALIANLFATAVTDLTDVVSCRLRPECVAKMNANVVATIRSHMDAATDPCDNFWQHACGKWTAAPYFDHVDTFGAVANFYRDQLSAYLESEETDVELEQLLHQLRSFYAACTATSTHSSRLHEYLNALPEAVLVGVKWPRGAFESALPKKWSAKSFQWLDAVAQLRRYGLNDVLLREDVGFAANDSRRYVVQLGMPAAEADAFQSKQDVLRCFAKLGWLDASAKSGTMDSLLLAEEVFELEMQLRELRANRRLANDETDELLTLGELSVKVGNTDWHRYFALLLGEAAPPTLPVEVEDAAYLRDLSALMQQTDAHTIGFYVFLRLCKFLLAARPRATDGRSCVQHMQLDMALGIDYLYQAKLYRTKAADERAIDGIVERLKRQFSRYLRRNKMQLSRQQVDFLQQKLRKLSWRLGNLPLHRSADYYNDYYRHVNISARGFYSNHWELMRHRMQQRHAFLLRQEREKVAFDMNAYFVDDDVRRVRSAPYFAHPRNLLIVPASCSQLPFFDHRLHPLLQQSLMGWILAHELSHGFDGDGILLDGDGAEHPLGLAIKQRPRFRAALQCLRRTGSASLNERVADVNGFQLAYDAYFESYAGQQMLTSPQDFSAAELWAKKLYFLNFAQFFCGELPTAVDHDRDDVRVVQIVANMPEFAEVFQCGRDAPENPEPKCHMWR